MEKEEQVEEEERKINLMPQIIHGSEKPPLKMR